MKRLSLSPGDFKRRSRRGGAMIFGLVALIVASTMIASLLRTASLSHRQVKRDQFRLQASLLADAGYARAVAILRREPESANGEWIVSADQFEQGRTAKVHFDVVADPDGKTKREVVIVAEFPSGHPDQVRLTRHIPLP